MMVSDIIRPEHDDTDVRKAAPALLDRAEKMLATYERRGNTNVPGTITLILDLAATLRAEMRGWAHARGDAVDYSLRADELEAIVRDLAARTDFLETHDTCPLCGAFDPPEHTPACAQRRAVEFVSSHPVSGGEPCKTCGGEGIVGSDDNDVEDDLCLDCRGTGTRTVRPVSGDPE